MNKPNGQILEVKTEIRNNNQMVALLEDAFITFQWIDRLQGKSRLSSTSQPSLTSPPSSPTQPTWCAPTFSKWFNLQDSHAVSFSLTFPAFFLWLIWSSGDCNSTQKNNWTTFTTFWPPFTSSSMINHPSRLSRASSNWCPYFASASQAKLSRIY